MKMYRRSNYDYVIRNADVKNCNTDGVQLSSIKNKTVRKRNRRQLSVNITYGAETDIISIICFYKVYGCLYWRNALRNYIF